MSTASPGPGITVIQQGDAKPDPFTILIIANPALETPYQSGAFAVDPIAADRSAFDACCVYIITVLFGGLPGQAEKFLGDQALGPKVRVLSLFASGLPPVAENALVGEDSVSDGLLARRDAFVPFLARHGLAADVAYAVSLSPTHSRASTFFTTDDDSRPGVGFTLDGVSLSHRFYNLIPGAIALHATASSLTALHEFAHALGSYSNGSIVDLYVDDGPGVNSKRGRPVPPTFARYNAEVFETAADRDGLGPYPWGWQSYQCERNDPAYPAIMDDYWMAPGGRSVACQHDRITRQFLMDRLRAKLSR
jgi:hypothetical protein